MKTRYKIVVLALTASAVCQGLYAQAAPQSQAPQDEDVVVLSPFEVSAEQDRGYQATQTLAGTRIRTNLADVGSAISVVTREFLQDVGATDSGTLLQYTTNAEVGGTRGTYAGLGSGQSLDESSRLRAPGGGVNRVRGLAEADTTRDFFVTDIPWDSFNVDRVDIQRGPNSILFGLGSPAGIINASLRNAEFRNLGSVEVRAGSYGTIRSSIDVNQEILPDVLAIRLDGLWNDQSFQQDQAFQEDKRFYGAIMDVLEVPRAEIGEFVFWDELAINQGGPVRVADLSIITTVTNVPTEESTNPVIEPIDPGTVGVAYVQLSLQSTQAEADRSLQYAMERWAGLLGGAVPEVVQAGTVFHVRVPTRSVESANALCEAIKSAGGGCYITQA